MSKNRPPLPKLPVRSEDEKKWSDDYYSFDWLLSWTKAVLETHGRYQTADAEYMRLLDVRRKMCLEPEWTLEKAHDNADASWIVKHRGQCERHFFLNAAHQMFRYSDWVVARGITDRKVFAEIDAFRDSVRRLRDMHEHADEYFKTDGQGGRKPHEWWHIADGGISDASSTHNGKFGNLLDPKDLSAAVERLLPKLIELDPGHLGPRARREQIARMNARRS